MNGNDVVEAAVQRATRARAEEIRLRPIGPTLADVIAAVVIGIAILAFMRIEMP